MPLQQSDILKICEILSDQQELRVATNESFKGACYTFIAAFLGGLVGGPVGLGVGSAAGGIVAAHKSQGKFKSATYVIMHEMSEKEKKMLAESVQNVIRKIDATDVLTVMAMLNADSIMKNMVIDTIKGTLTSNMGLTLI